jgi:3-dehydroquinate dehydratase-2
MKDIHIVNGPNLNLLGRRQTDIYGSVSFEDYLLSLRAKFPDILIHYFQSNHEGDIIDYLHKFGFSNTGIILNAGAYTHTSIAIGDAIASITTPVIEVHISKVSERESYRRVSYLSQHCKSVIEGKGLDGYEEAINALINEGI